MKHEESQHQCALFEWAAHYPVLRWMHSIPNGAYLAGDSAKDRAIRGGRLKKEGMKAGVLDVFLPLVALPYHGLYVEMKTKKGTLSKEQEDFREWAELQGYKVVVCRDVGEAIAAVREYARL